MLKFEGFEVGQRIKAYDFKPFEGREENYVLGKIIEIVTHYGAKCYLIAVEEDTMRKAGARTEVFVPMEVAFMEYDERISLVGEV